MEKLIDKEWVLVKTEIGETKVLHLCGEQMMGLWPTNKEERCCVICKKQIPNHVNIYVD